MLIFINFKKISNKGIFLYVIIGFNVFWIKKNDVKRTLERGDEYFLANINVVKLL
jgi:hypothetical protein